LISRNSVGGKYPVVTLGTVVDFLDSKRRPVTESERKAGPYPYYGANGLQGTIDGYIFDEPLVLLAEDGGHFGAPERGIAYRVSGKTWVNNHAHVIRPKAGLDLAYLCRVLENYDVSPFVTGTTRGKLTKAGAADIPIPVAPLPEQRRNRCHPGPSRCPESQAPGSFGATGQPHAVDFRWRCLVTPQPIQRTGKLDLCWRAVTKSTTALIQRRRGLMRV
jgi:hypothetical protein